MPHIIYPSRAGIGNRPDPRPMDLGRDEEEIEKRLCIYCCSEPESEENRPYCSTYCAVMAKVS